eukprot:712500-Pelagomonas_calceolata.AAC.2
MTLIIERKSPKIWTLPTHPPLPTSSDGIHIHNNLVGAYNNLRISNTDDDRLGRPLASAYLHRAVHFQPRGAEARQPMP